MAEELEIVVTATDRASGPLGNIEKSVSGLSRAGGGLTKSFGGLQKAMGVGLLGAAGAVAGGFVALGTGIGKAVQLGSEAEEMMGKFNVVFASTGGAVSKTLDAFAMSVGRSKFELRGMASTFGDTLKPMGFTEQAAADMAVSLSELAVDLGSFNNMETDEALRRLQGTLIGSHENALAFGVIINENTLKTELAAQGWDTLTGSALEQAKVQARINLLMKGTTDAQGDALRTSGGWANTMRRLKSILTDFGTEIGMRILPLLTPLLSRFTEFAQTQLPLVLDRVSNALQWLSDNLHGLGRLAEDIWNAIEWIATGKGWDIDWWWDITDNINKLTGGLLGTQEEADALAVRLGNLGKSISAGIETVKKFLKPIWEAIAGFVSWKDVLIAAGVVIASIVIPALVGIVASMAPILIAAAALIGGIALLRTAWENDFMGMRTAITQFWEQKLQPAFVEIQRWARENLPGALQTLRTFWTQRLLPAIEDVWAFIQENLIPLFTTLVDVWFAAMKLELAVLSFWWKGYLLPALRDVWEFIKEHILPIFEDMSGGVSGISDAIAVVVGWLDRLAQKFTEVANKLPSYLIPGSPTLLEIGFRGIADAMREMRSVADSVQFGVQMPRPSYQTAVAADGPISISMNISGATDPVQTGRAARDGVLEAMRRRGN